MAETKKPAGAKTIIDVAHPGKSAPAANSKSVIISNRPILKDPMMVDDVPADTEDAANGSPPAKTAPEIDTGKPSLAEPLLEPETSAEAAKPSKAPTIAELAEAAASDKQGSEPKPGKEDTPEPDKDETDSADDPEATGEDGEALPSKTEDDEKLELEATEQAKHQAAIEKLAESKKYYLPINAIEKRRSRRFVVLGVILSLLLIVAWADVALDAGLVKAGGVKPLTHFFSN